MVKNSQELEKEFIDSLKPTTEKDLKEWMVAIKGCGIEKRNDIIKWLKADYGFGQMNANLLMGIYNNNGKPVYASETSLLDNQFAKYENMRPLYEKISGMIQSTIPDSNIIVKKTYVSFALKREFAAVNIKKGELRMGLDLGEMPFSGKVEKAKLTGPMPRISHMVVLKTKEDFDDEVVELIKKSNERVNT